MSDSKLDEARAHLVDAAKQHAAKATDGTLKALCEMATAYAKTRAQAARPASDVVMPFGKSKNKTLDAASLDDLEWMLPKIKTSIDDPEKARWRDDNIKLAAALEAELAARR